MDRRVIHFAQGAKIVLEMDLPRPQRILTCEEWDVLCKTDKRIKDGGFVGVTDVTDREDSGWLAHLWDRADSHMDDVELDGRPMTDTRRMWEIARRVIHATNIIAFGLESVLKY